MKVLRDIVLDDGLSLAITAGLGIGTLAGTIHPCPTRAEVWKRLGDQWNRERLTPRVHELATRYLEWRR